MNVTICKEMRMAMAHRRPHHDGKCRQLHGHTYVVRVYVAGEVQPVSEDNPQSGMVVDFGVVKEFLKSVEGRMDHQFGDETMDEYPTAEQPDAMRTGLFVAGYFRVRLLRALDDASLHEKTSR